MPWPSGLHDGTKWVKSAASAKSVEPLHHDSSATRRLFEQRSATARHVMRLAFESQHPASSASYAINCSGAGVRVMHYGV